MDEAPPSPLRVFLSHTSELREHPASYSFVAAAERAIVRAGHAIVDMAYFTASDLAPAELCRRRVREAQVVVVLAGFHYGSPVREEPSMSYTELEYSEAVASGVPRLVFLLDEQADGSGVLFRDVVHGARQEAFRGRLKDSGATTATVGSPTELETKLYQALVERRWLVGPGAAAVPVAPPAGEPWTQRADVDHDRLFGTDIIGERVATALSNPDGDWAISIFGDGGAGKTALAYQTAKGAAGHAGFGRVAWVSAKLGRLRLLGDLEYDRRATFEWQDLLLDIGEQLRLDVERDPTRTEDGVVRALASLAPHERCLIVIDNLETVRDVQLVARFVGRSSALRSHKIMVTSRRSASVLGDRIREFGWRGISDDAVRDFASHLAADDPGFELRDADLDKLVAMSCGLPLMVKLAMRVAMHDARPLTTVIEQVSDPRGALGEQVGVYLYEQAMDALAASPGVGPEAAAGIMNVFCARPSGESFTDREFFELSLLPDRAVFDRARAAAHGLALIRGVDGNRRFTVHPLLREFVCGESGTVP